ncbi:inner-membrane translocator [Ammonifex degensii KC4]|uniref:Inner-membrane translocator n=1 Tax=Ammonifex degensii (strain DSM 10501 / KC4) TaxID=429009 RepID=C9R8R1_AMMDK|nr:branched-chain amino acid ABC transporter permease [Ammonifex degensii]ACX52690.1 inner-membrane translocator [Ammonifex degensii KC4]
MRLRFPWTTNCGLFFTRYEEDQAFLPSRAAKIKVLCLFALLLALPWLVGPYPLRIASQVAIMALGAVGLNLLTGFAGQISVGHAAFMGVGAYTVGALTTKLGLSFWLALPLGGLAAALVGAFFGLPSLRLKGLYLAIATLAAQVILDFAFVRLEPITGGAAGLVLTPPSLGPFSLADDTVFYYVVLALAVVGVIFALNLSRSRVGRAFMAIRDRDLAAAMLGVDLFGYKLRAFFLSSFYAGLAGGMLAAYTRVVTPEQFTLDVSIQFLAMIVIGGLGDVLGSVYGAAFVSLLPIALSYLAQALQGVFPQMVNLLSACQTALFGLVIILFLIFEPQGLAKLWRHVKDYFRLWPFSY